MEPVGPAVGVVGLAGLFSSCLEAVDMTQSYLHFEGDNHVLDTKFAAVRVQLKRWGRQVGFEDGKLLANHHSALDDADISAAVVSLLTITKAICTASDAVPRHLKRTNSGFTDGSQNIFYPGTVPGVQSKRKKLAWALWGKNEREEQVNMFGDLVRELHNLVPLGSSIGPEQPGQPSTRSDNQAEARRDVTLWLMGSQLPDERFEESNRKRLEGTCGWILDRNEFSEWVSPIVDSTKVLWITGPAGFGCTLIADGLDEIPSVSRFLEAVLDAAAGTNTRVLMVSRDETMIRQALTGHCDINFTEYKISLEDVQSDTKACSRSIVDRKLPNKSEDIRSDLSETMAARCEGQFLWLELQEETLRKGMSKKQLERVIGNAPAGLERLYDQNWKKISEFRESEKVRAFTLLRWVAFAQRPLTVSEVTGAVLIHDEMDELMLDDLPDDVDDDYIETEIVGLSQTFFGETVPIESSSFALMDIGKRAPATILRADAEHLDGENSRADITFEISFRQYASSFWYNHLKSGSESVAELAALTRKFFERGNPSWISWCIWFESQNCVKIDSNTALQDPLCYAIKLGLRQTALALLESGELDLRGSTTTGRLVTVEACGSGDIEIVKKVFEKGGDVASRINDGWTCLMNASQYGHVDIVKLLLKMNTDVSEQDCNKTTPLFIAARYGHIEVVKILLEHGADPNATQERGWTPVAAASNENL
ncbi:ankyrin repeat domain-containing protein 52 [Fusarium austroafricanum]|uniref:Ankyrin repeat domain-containing protein 52 n=1 Tax=Fusarium austroafricanum TaxID=2364996 RepID=A0A8H4NDV3_9HYPO|nr:ankyrin repeat domain-containing protein 52 [Fusarium austroafricanum]